MRELAESKGGKCLSETYVNSQTKLKWKCDEGHTWEAIPNSIKRGRWCPFCAHKVPLTIEEMQKMAESRGGKCLSATYANTHIHLKWQCKEGHVWDAWPSNIKAGKWCPICSAGVSERICRKFFETMFHQEFPRARPKWLMGVKGRSLEFDGYCKRLGLAFEYHGEQHFQKNHRFHDRIKLDERQEYDKRKQELCRQNNVTLIEIPYTVKYEDMQQYITTRCAEHGIKIPETSRIDYKEFEGVYSSNLLKKTDMIARSKGGRCLSTKYITALKKLEYECKNGHRWFARPGNIASGIWCPYCVNKAKLTIEEMQKIAESKNGKCLSKEYINSHTKLKWQCKEGHTWEADASGIKSGTWCPKCGGTSRKTIEDIQKIAKSKGGECLTSEYINKDSLLKFRCNKGHEWQTKASNILAHHWCQKCILERDPWNKGKKTGLIPWSKSQKGIHLSPKSEFKKGVVPWNKGKSGYMSGDKNPFFGKHHSEETKHKMSEIKKRVKTSKSPFVR
jgi:hypothetical protein